MNKIDNFYLISTGQKEEVYYTCIFLIFFFMNDNMNGSSAMGAKIEH